LLQRYTVSAYSLPAINIVMYFWNHYRSACLLSCCNHQTTVYAVVKVRGQEARAPPAVGLSLPLLKYQLWLPKIWPGLHCMRAVVLSFVIKISSQ